MGQIFRSGFVDGTSGSGSLMSLQSECLLWLQPAEGISEVRSTSRVAHDTPDKLSGGFISTPCGLLHRDVWLSSWHGTWLLPEPVIQQRVGRKLQCLLWPSLGSHSLLFLKYLIGSTCQLYLVCVWWGKNYTRGVNTGAIWRLATMMWKLKFKKSDTSTSK